MENGGSVDRAGDGSRRAAKAGQGRGVQGRVIRDSFTMPAADYGLIGALKQRCIGLGVAVKKSELLRAGLTVLSRLPDESLAGVVAAIESVKTGRPPGKKKGAKGRGKKKRRPNGKRDRKQ